MGPHNIVKYSLFINETKSPGILKIIVLAIPVPLHVSTTIVIVHWEIVLWTLTRFENKNSLQEQELSSRTRTRFKNKNLFQEQELASRTRTRFKNKNSLREQKLASGTKTRFENSHSLREQKLSSRSRNRFENLHSLRELALALRTRTRFENTNTLRELALRTCFENSLWEFKWTYFGKWYAAVCKGSIKAETAELVDVCSGNFNFQQKVKLWQSLTWFELIFQLTLRKPSDKIWGSKKIASKNV
jgi:hypothetical protein